MSLSKCLLRCSENTHEPFILEHGKEFTVGRGPDTKIKDSRCSRNQVKFKADCIKKQVEVIQIGRNACGYNGLALKKDVPVTVTHGDRIEILLGQHIHIIEFDPPSAETKADPKESASSNSGQAKKLHEISASEDEDSDDTPVAKKFKKSTPSQSEASGAFSTSCWESLDGGKLLVFTPEGVRARSAIAAYDLDGTIIGTTSGGVFPKHRDDWKILYPEILGRLKEMHEKKHKIIFFTNQAGLSSGKQDANDFKRKIENIVKKLLLPIQVFISTSYSIYRKPCTGMWEAALERNEGIKVDMVKSFYCGDAAGRTAEMTNAKKDFSHTDLLFAKNLQLHFVTPEHHFLDKKMPLLKVNVFDPNAIPCDIPLCEPSWGQVISNKTEVIILVGCPGSGKSHFAKTHLVPAGYVHVNRDTLGTFNKCVSVTEQALRNRQRVVIDNTNPDAESRRRYIDVAQNFTSLVRCFIMNTSLQHAKHNNKFRQLTDPTHAVVTDIVLHTYNNKYEEPTKNEGFTEILRINFWPTFKNPKHEKLYKMFLLEK